MAEEVTQVGVCPTGHPFQQQQAAGWERISSEGMLHIGVKFPRRLADARPTKLAATLPPAHFHMPGHADCVLPSRSYKPDTGITDVQADSQRRMILNGLIAGAGATLSFTPARAAADSPRAFTTTESGIKIQQLVEGSGPRPSNGDVVLIDYTLRRSNGYFVYSTVEGVSFQPKDIPVTPVAFRLGVDARWIPGLQEIVAGMRQGGKLRALIPPSLGYQDCNVDEPQPPTFATKRQLVNHCREPLLFEVALLRVTPSSSP